MNIIIDPSQVDEFKEKYIVLELDKIKVLANNKEITAYCLVESVPLTEMSLIEHKRRLHENLIEHYRKKDWDYCNNALDQLVGSWGGEVDSFYADIRSRITQYLAQDPGDNWTGIIEKH